MVDVYMTPQSEEEDLSDGINSPSDPALSPSDKESKTEQTSPPVSTFLQDLDEPDLPDSTKMKDSPVPTNTKFSGIALSDLQAVNGDGENKEIVKDNRNEVEEEKKEEKDGDGETDEAE